MSESVAYTYTDGMIRFAAKCPRGALPIAHGDKTQLRAAIEPIARHGHARGVLLVPGMPEAKNASRALNALVVFRNRVQQSPAPRACRVCGCTNDRACQGGCYWVERDLCSACADKS